MPRPLRFACWIGSFLLGCGGTEAGEGPGGTAGAPNGTAGGGTTSVGGAAGSGAALAGSGGTTVGGAGAGATPGGGAGGAAGGVGGNPSTGGAGAAAGGSSGTTAGAGGSSAGSAGSVAGSAGAAGAPVVCPPPPGNGLVGWATQGGGTLGGGTASAMTVTSASALEAALAGTDPRVVRFSGTLSVGALEIGSNKTLEGASATATLNGGIQIEGATNVIVRNLRINAASSDVAGDGISVSDSRRVWIDHVEIYDAPDGNLDITDGSDYITVSWSKFRYTGSGDHRFSSLIGSDDNDSGSYRITFHHNWWAERVLERMPRVRFGQVHVLNNYYSSSGNDHCVRAAFNSNVRVEKNYFENVRTPHEIDEDDGGPAILQSIDNHYVLSLNTGGNLASRGTAFTPPYTFTAEPAPCVKATVMQGAGPR